MDPLTIVFKHSSLNMIVFSLDDIATLKCVSKDLKQEFDIIYKKPEKHLELELATMKSMGFDCEPSLKDKTALKRDLYLKYMVQLDRYYNDDTIKNNDKCSKLISFLNEFTSKNAMKVFTNFRELTFDEQLNTVSELLSFTHNNENIASNTLAIYLIFYFISKLYTQNGKLFIKNKKKCILSCNEFKFLCISKGTELIFKYKNMITLFPYTFIDKLIRLIQETNRKLANI